MYFSRMARRPALRKKGIHLFTDLPDLNKLKIIASDISNGKMVIFPDDLPNLRIFKLPLFSIAKAVRIEWNHSFLLRTSEMENPQNGSSLVHMVSGGIFK